MSNSIFVQIASYRDPELVPTLLDLIEQAGKPENLQIVVCWQHGDEQSLGDFIQASFKLHIGEVNQSDDLLHSLSYMGASIKLIDVDYLATEGACWARNKVQQYYSGEKYTLQLDSHHRFIARWDEDVIAMLECMRDESAKPVLTAYLPAYNPNNDPEGRNRKPSYLSFDYFTPAGVLLIKPNYIGDWEKLKKPVRSRFYSGHFTFADGSFAVEVQHDPEYFFHGEEISIAVRAFTHGYDLYHPYKVLAWHEYTRENRTKVWDDHSTERKEAGEVKLAWHERDIKCFEKNRALLGMSNDSLADFDKYGLGSVRTLAEYEAYAGISFKYRAVQQTVLDCKIPEKDYVRSYSDVDWRNSLIRPNTVSIAIHRNELGDGPLEDYKFWYVGVHDKDRVEIYREDLWPEKMFSLLDKSHKDWVMYSIQFCSPLDCELKTYRIWPVHKEKGWMKITDRNVQ
ncbi:UDP-N-acetylglucosamine-transferase [Neisseriaceae bacterium TC5R-5]|nr:UDP-N-acetylglucosamine-transferase [Neisseriaceae bacterium TC5R-5]